MKTTISTATRQNWKKLNTDTKTRLTTRANKTKSRKKFIPVEYFTNQDNRGFVQEIVRMIDENRWDIDQSLYTIGMVLLKQCGIDEKEHVRRVMEGFQITEIPELSGLSVPFDERDLLGLIYQSTMREGKKNIIGSYYTPATIVSDMVKGFDFSTGQLFLDPCCGSGAFLLSVEHARPDQLAGFDSDPVAVMIARINLLLKYPEASFMPGIVCLDYLRPGKMAGHPLMRQTFDYIATNPPWGAVSDFKQIVPGILSGESFSLFYVKAYRQLKPGGMIRFLFPESVLHVKCHKDIRAFMLEHGRLEQITVYDGAFTGVTTGYVDIMCKQQSAPPPVSSVTVRQRGRVLKVDRSFFYETEKNAFRLLDDSDIRLLRYLKSQGRFSLKDSDWALGIVTGDNKNKLKAICEAGYEAIYTGKEIMPFVLKPAQQYLKYDRTKLQQAARDEYYRAKEKLVYKFISDRLVFAYDDTGSLFLNSANILIPNIPRMSIKTALAFLNSEVLQYYYMQMFGDVKILKGNLMELPFPEITEAENIRLEQLANQIIDGSHEAKEQLQMEIFRVFHLSDAQIEQIRNHVKTGTLP